jgi:hypothetical protein
MPCLEINLVFALRCMPLRILDRRQCGESVFDRLFAPCDLARRRVSTPAWALLPPRLDGAMRLSACPCSKRMPFLKRTPGVCSCVQSFSVASCPDSIPLRVSPPSPASFFYPLAMSSIAPLSEAQITGLDLILSHAVAGGSSSAPFKDSLKAFLRSSIASTGTAMPKDHRTR